MTTRKKDSLKIEKILERFAQIINDEFSGIVAEKDEVFAFIDEDETLKIKILSKGVEIDKNLNVTRKDFIAHEQLSESDRQNLVEEYMSSVQELKSFFDTHTVEEYGDDFYHQFLEYFLALEDVVEHMRNAGIFVDISTFDRNSLDNIIRTKKVTFEN